MKLVMVLPVVLALVAGCRQGEGHGGGPAATSAPARIERPTSLEGLSTVVLREDAEAALGIEVTAVEMVEAAVTLSVGGEVTVPAGREVVLAAPVGGRVGARPRELPRPGEHVEAGQLLLTLIPLASVDRDVRSRARRDLEVANAELGLAETRLTRAEAMAADKSGSVRALEDARAARRVAQASVDAAQARLRTLDSGSLDADLSLSIRSPAEGVVRAVRITSGQSVPQGAALLEIAAAGRWVRATFPASDGVHLDGVREARARRLGSSEPVALVMTPGPPSADPIRGTVDRFFVLPASADWTPGERVLVEVVTTTSSVARTLAVPITAVVRDAEGSAWVYERTAAHTYRRRRVEQLRRDGDRMLLLRGVSSGAAVVRVGAAELWGFELGADR